MAKEQSEKVKKRYVVGSVPETTRLTIFDTETETHEDLYSALAEIRNDVAEIKKSLN